MKLSRNHGRNPMHTARTYVGTETLVIFAAAMSARLATDRFKRVGASTKLIMALAACMLRYGEIGMWLKKEAPNSRTAGSYSRATRMEISATLGRSARVQWQSVSVHFSNNLVHLPGCGVHEVRAR